MKTIEELEALREAFEGVEIDGLMIPDILADAIATKRENERLRGLAWLCWNELNTLCASGAFPLGVSEKWWSDLTAALEKTLGDDVRPWPSEEAKSVIVALGSDDNG